jgi:hypothetical protein
MKCQYEKYSTAIKFIHNSHAVRSKRPSDALAVFNMSLQLQSVTNRGILLEAT